ncbi:hypothetical protein GCM10010483_20220 [Actinokineospora diospyrosa]
MQVGCLRAPQHGGAVLLVYVRAQYRQRHSPVHSARVEVGSPKSAGEPAGDGGLTGARRAVQRDDAPQLTLSHHMLLQLAWPTFGAPFCLAVFV